MENDIAVSVAEIAFTGERRRSARVYQPFPTRVRGVAKTGESFSIDTVVDNISATGLYLKVPLEIDAEPLMRVIVCFKLSEESSRGARLRVLGKVLRTERLPDGKCGVAIAMKSYRFI